MRWVVRVGPVAPSEDVREAPGADLGFVGGEGHCGRGGVEDGRPGYGYLKVWRV